VPVNVRTASLALPAERKNNAAAITLGIIGVVFSAIGLLVAWLPILGCVGLPLLTIGFVLSVIGLILSACDGFKSFGAPLAGLIVSLLGVIIFILAAVGFAALIEAHNAGGPTHFQP